jgi:hypothetical protein
VANVRDRAGAGSRYAAASGPSRSNVIDRRARMGAADVDVSVPSTDASTGALSLASDVARRWS